jgi:hypothetical protein
MSERSKVLRRIKNWKRKAIDRGKEGRAKDKVNGRVKKERDKYKKEVLAAQKEALEAKAELERLRDQVAIGPHGPQNKLELVHLALMLFLVARIGFRAISRVLDVLCTYLGLSKAPCPQTISNWVTRLSIAKIQMPPQSIGNPVAREIAKDHVWLIDLSIGLGAGKILTVLALNLKHHQLNDHAPTLEDVRCVAVSVENSWTGESIADFLKSVITRTGSPSAFLKDGGADLKKAVGILNESEQGTSSLSIADISHTIANLFKHEYGEHC